MLLCCGEREARARGPSAQREAGAWLIPRRWEEEYMLPYEAGLRCEEPGGCAQRCWKAVVSAQREFVATASAIEEKVLP